RFRNCRSR
ncbi:hypothetical protein FUMI01_25490, partial [Flavobacterium sp. UMI-01]